MGIINPNAFTANLIVRVIPSEDSNANIMTIIIGILGCILLAGLIVILAIIIRNSIRMERTINPENRIKRTSNILNEE